MTESINAFLGFISSFAYLNSFFGDETKMGCRLVIGALVFLGM